MKRHVCHTRLTIRQILNWADAYHRRTGRWPNAKSGPVFEAPEQTWQAIQMALNQGNRGLPGGNSLARLLNQAGRKRNPRALPGLSEEQILQWAEEHFRHTGEWPHERAGPVWGREGESWGNVDRALRMGRRGLPRGSSLARLLAAAGRKRNRSDLPPLTLEEIESWARNHRRRIGEWPTKRSGRVLEAPHESWARIHRAFLDGRRGLPLGMTLHRLVRRLNQVWLATEYVPIRAQWMKQGED